MIWMARDDALGAGNGAGGIGVISAAGVFLSLFDSKLLGRLQRPFCYLWYFSPRKMLKARYNCSSNSTVDNSCENVILDNERVKFAILPTSVAVPSGPPIMKVRYFLLCDAKCCKYLARSSDVNIAPFLSKRIFQSVLLSRSLILLDSLAIISETGRAAIFSSRTNSN